MMSRMLLSPSCVFVFLLYLSHEINGRHLSTIDDHSMDDKAKLLSHSTIKLGFGNDQLTIHDDLNLKSFTAKVNDQTNNFGSEHYKQTDSCGSKNKKDMIKDLKLKKFKEIVRHHHCHHHRPKSIIFQVPSKNKQVHQQPGFNLDYSPPKTHPPSHN
ncbi:hypothetical protein E3N88_37107 [Mikania micrantha]|uniref:Uncharacterized protein n=1 Tax=Mikania micrantha TaxID=192012 RepID=A0A5N6M5U3_9ASTR|nr:hypothetical protein E3N88_37107 [Mikania micrantha]